MHDDRGIVASVERQMRLRAMTMENQERTDRRSVAARCSSRALQFVAISREAGAGGREIGLAVGQRLGWTVYDQNLLDRVAERFHVSRMMLDLVDETHSNWVYDVLGTWMDRQIVPHEKFVAYLSRIVSEESKHGNAVFIGRAVQFLLSCSQLLAVRIIASEKYRVQKIMDRMNLGEVDARRIMHELDAGRREFVQRFFRRDVTDPHHYDLVINAERCGQQAAVEEIVAAVTPRSALQPA
jgi:cytidylate kinase